MFQILPAENSKKPFQSGSFPAQKHNSHWMREVLWVKIDKFRFVMNSHWLRAWVRLEGLLWIFNRWYLKQTLIIQKKRELQIHELEIRLYCFIITPFFTLFQIPPAENSKKPFQCNSSSQPMRIYNKTELVYFHSENLS